MSTETEIIATEKRLWRFEAFTLPDYAPIDILEAYVNANTFVWCEDAEAAENWILDCMDGGERGEHGTHKIYQAEFSEITANDLQFIQMMSNFHTIGADNDENWPPSVFIMRELIYAYQDWRAVQ